MKKKRFLFLLLAMAGVLGISFYLMFFTHFKELEQVGSYVRIPVRFIPFINAPVIDVEIEGSKYSLNIDLGSSHFFVLHKNILDRLNNKEFIEVEKFFDIKGNEYQTSQFLIPKVEIQKKLKIKGGIANEESIGFLAHGSQILPDIPFLHKTITGLYMLVVEGRVGWPFFNQGDCIIDFPNAVVYFAKDMSSLVDEAGYSLDGFTRIPFEIERCGVILPIQTDLGIKRFLLDTGCTWSMFRRSQVEKKGWWHITNKFMIDGTDFGVQKFWVYDFSDRINCDGILGVDFFKKHTIGLDFHNKVAYIKRSSE